ncbi:MAG TPA: MFS transporter [Flexivirga sp.]|uniref:MFS transporter n=1 Tax=Flexivirga sp. TaxID=1962927 RepID=UPI002D0B8837|nr:MFS transporter [Flexivirga sp.]HWC23032.1 MFS transporter [Flexivirga sp.]
MVDAGRGLKARAPFPVTGLHGWLVPAGAGRDAVVLLQARGVRALGDGVVSVVLASYLTSLGLTAIQVGMIVTATLFGSAALTLVSGLHGHRVERRRLLRWMSLLMIATGAAFACCTVFWPLLVVALVGTLNPSAGDVSAFLSTEQALLPATAPHDARTDLFARYALVGTLVAAVGSLGAGVPSWVGGLIGASAATSQRWIFAGYAILGVILLARYRRLSPAVEPSGGTQHSPLGASRPIVHRLAALFSLDAFGGGFSITVIVALWLQERFELSLVVTGQLFFWAGALSAFSALVAVRLARRIGLVRTMVFTHLPANGFLILAALMPTAPLAVAALLARSALSQMDVPVRNSYVMAVVSPGERQAAASITNVPRSLAAAVPPLLAGWLLAHSDFGWPLIIGGGLRVLYDLELLRQFRDLTPPEEAMKSPAVTPDSDAEQASCETEILLRDAGETGA